MITFLYKLNYSDYLCEVGKHYYFCFTDIEAETQELWFSNSTALQAIELDYR